MTTVSSSSLLFLVLVALLFSSLPTTSAAIWLPHVISSNMVLPRAPRVARIWGKATPGTLVSVYLNDSGPAYSSSADPTSGSFVVVLPPLRTSVFPTTVSIEADKEVVTLSNVKFGDVLLCSGQSNMQMSVYGCDDRNVEAAAAANYPHMSLFSVWPNISSTPLDDVPVQYFPFDTTGWVRTSNATVYYPNDFWFFSALCYQTGRRVYDALNGTVPIGLLSSSRGGTVIES